MQLQNRIKKLETIRPAGEKHFVWQDQGETREQAIAGYKEAHQGPIGPNDDFCVLRWAESQAEANGIITGQGEGPT